MKQKYTVTVAVSAFNEEANILNFMKSVLKQKEEGFALEKILIISDGSTDNTVGLIRSLKSKKIQVLDSKKRIGKSSRLNQIYKLLNSDFLVQADADTLLAHPKVIYEMVTPLIKNPLVGMCGGQIVPLPGRTFTEKADEITFKIYMKYLKSIRNGNCVFCSDGRILSFRKELAKKIQIPKDMIANDVYTYYMCKTLGFKFKYAKKAIVYFRSAQSLEDKLRQNLRSAAVPLRMKKYFPEDLIKRESYIPKSIMIKSLVMQFLKDPVKAMYIFFVNKYCHIKSEYSEKTLNAKWPIALTTKKLI